MDEFGEGGYVFSSNKSSYNVRKFDWGRIFLFSTQLKKSRKVFFYGFVVSF